MLALERGEGEKLRIGSSIVTIVRIYKDKVKLGIEAAPEIPILREEIYQKMKKEGTVRSLANR